MSENQPHPVDWAKLPLFKRMSLTEYTLRRQKEADDRSTNAKPTIIASDSDSDDYDDFAYDNAGKSVRIPQLPDMRFEPVFLASIRPFLKPKEHVSSTQRYDTPGEVLWLTGDVDVDITGFWWSVFKSQVVMQFLTGVAKALFSLLKLDFFTYLHSTGLSSSKNQSQPVIRWSALKRFFNFGFGGSR